MSSIHIIPQVAARLNHTPKWPTANGVSTPAIPPPPTPKSDKKIAAPASVGQSLNGVRSRNPLDLIKASIIYLGEVCVGIIV